jgi:hypothetical protein
MTNAWRWAGTRSIGTSHAKAGSVCQDYAACLEFDTARGSVLAAVVSDGAGSASRAEAGARLACAGFLRAARDHFRQGLGIEDIGEETALDWMDGIRERINAFAFRSGIHPRDCAATLVSVLAGPRSALVLHVGDGAAVVREQGSADWIVPSWPFHGEYASTTAFVTDDPSPRLSVEPLPVRLDRVAVFSDGLERLVLDHAQRAAFGPFFDRMLSPVAASGTAGHDRALSHALRTYLDGTAVCDRTDDDKSLILGARL